MTFKSYPIISHEFADGVINLVDSDGKVVFAILDAHMGDIGRVIEMWNALRHVAFPANHLNATEAYVMRLEKLRRAAVADLEAERTAHSEVSA